MKKVILLFSFLLIAPAYAACSIDSGGACSIADVTNSQMPSEFSSHEVLNRNHLENSNAEIPAYNDNVKERELRDFGPQSKNYSYNTNCQFGICSTGGSPKLFYGR